MRMIEIMKMMKYFVFLVMVFLLNGLGVSADLIEDAWNEYVIGVKNHVTLTENADVLITSDNDSMELAFDAFIMTLNYNDGIVSFQGNQNADDTELMGYSIYQIILFDVLFTKFNYGTDVYDYIANNKNLTIEQDGFEYISKSYSIKEEDNGISVDFSGDAFTSFKFDLINGLKNYNANADQPIPEEDEPGTGMKFNLITLAMLFIAGTGGIYINNKINSKIKVVKL